MLIGFNNGRYEANDLSAWLGSNPVDALTTNLGLPREVVQKLPRGEHFLFRVDLSTAGGRLPTKRREAGQTSRPRHVDRANDIGDWHLPTLIRLTILRDRSPPNTSERDEYCGRSTSDSPRWIPDKFLGVRDQDLVGPCHGALYKLLA